MVSDIGTDPAIEAAFQRKELEIVVVRGGHNHERSTTPPPIVPSLRDTSNAVDETATSASANTNANASSGTTTANIRGATKIAVAPRASAAPRPPIPSNPQNPSNLPRVPGAGDGEGGVESVVIPSFAVGIAVMFSFCGATNVQACANQVVDSDVTLDELTVARILNGEITKWSMAGVPDIIDEEPITIFAQDKDSGPMRAVKERLSIYDSSLSKPFDFLALKSSNTYATDQLVRGTAWDYVGDMCVTTHNTVQYMRCT